jgi:LysR family transcriptional regulator, glycine cleavage system transcriptional activator
MRHAYTPTLSELQAFVQAARSGSATGAAAALGLTQSAVSRALGTLEARLGVQLFLRLRQRLVLSDAGRAMLGDAERILADLQATALTVMSFGGHDQVLRIACLPSFGAVWLIPRLAGFATVAPQVTYDVSTTLSPLDFARDPRDVAVMRGPVSGQGLQVDVLCEEQLVAVAAPALVGAGPLADADLAALPLLQQSTRPNLWLNWFLHAGLDPITILRGPRFEQFAMVLAAAKAGLGVALVPEVLVAGDLAAGSLRRASERRLASGTPYVLVVPERSAPVPAVVQLRAYLAALVG